MNCLFKLIRQAAFLFEKHIFNKNVVTNLGKQDMRISTSNLLRINVIDLFDDL
jgi:hypothetical protein